MEKYALIRKKEIKQFQNDLKINRKTFPPSSFQLNSIIAPIDTPDIYEPEPIIEPIVESILLIEKQFDTCKSINRK